MKKFFLVLSLFAVSSAAVVAQDETTTTATTTTTTESESASTGNKPSAGSIGFTFGMYNPFGGESQWFNQGVGQTNTLLFRYYVADNIAARLGVGYTRAGVTDNNIEEGLETTEKSTESSFDISLGGQYSLGNTPKLEPYIGGDLVFGRGGVHEYFRSEVVNEAEAGRPVGDFEELDARASSMRIGLVPVIGFNYYFTKNFAFGAEFGWGYMATFSGGGSFTATTRAAGATTTVEGESEQSTRTGDFGNFGRGMLAISVFF